MPRGQARGLPLLNSVGLGRFRASPHPQSWLFVEVGGCGAWWLSRWEPARLPALAGPAASSGALRWPRQVAQRTGRRLGPLLDVPQHGDTEAAPFPSRCHPTSPHPALGQHQQRGGCRSIAATACDEWSSPRGEAPCPSSPAHKHRALLQDRAEEGSQKCQSHARWGLVAPDPCAVPSLRASSVGGAELQAWGWPARGCSALLATSGVSGIWQQEFTFFCGEDAWWLTPSAPREAFPPAPWASVALPTPSLPPAGGSDACGLPEGRTEGLPPCPAPRLCPALPSPGPPCPLLPSQGKYSRRRQGSPRRGSSFCFVSGSPRQPRSRNPPAAVTSSRCPAGALLPTAASDTPAEPPRPCSPAVLGHPAAPASQSGPGAPRGAGLGTPTAPSVRQERWGELPGTLPAVPSGLGGGSTKFLPSLGLGCLKPAGLNLHKGLGEAGLPRRWRDRVVAGELEGPPGLPACQPGAGGVRQPPPSCQEDEQLSGDTEELPASPGLKALGSCPIQAAPGTRSSPSSS